MPVSACDGRNFRHVTPQSRGNSSVGISTPPRNSAPAPAPAHAGQVSVRRDGTSQPVDAMGAVATSLALVEECWSLTSPADQGGSAWLARPAGSRLTRLEEVGAQPADREVEAGTQKKNHRPFRAGGSTHYFW